MSRLGRRLTCGGEQSVWLLVFGVGSEVFRCRRDAKRGSNSNWQFVTTVPVILSRPSAPPAFFTPSLQRT